MIFGRKARVVLGSMEYESDSLDFDFRVPFSTDSIPDVSEIALYNLSPDTVKQLKREVPVRLYAGYEGDVGLLCSGEVVNYETRQDGVDRKTTLKIADRVSAWTQLEVNKTYAAGTTSAQILTDLVSNFNLTIADITLKHNVTHRKARTVSGKLGDIIKKLSKETETKIYINQGSVYVRPPQKGAHTGFYLSGETGLLGSPERTEVVESEERFEGYKVSVLLNHQITTDSIIVIESETAKGAFRVVRGSHNSNEYKTEMEVLPWQA